MDVNIPALVYGHHEFSITAYLKEEGVTPLNIESISVVSDKGKTESSLTRDDNLCRTINSLLGSTFAVVFRDETNLKEGRSDDGSIDNCVSLDGFILAFREDGQCVEFGTSEWGHIALN